MSTCSLLPLTSPPSGGSKIADESWDVVSDEVRRLFVKAASKRGALNTIDLGGRRTFITAEVVLWASFGAR